MKNLTEATHTFMNWLTTHQQPPLEVLAQPEVILPDLQPMRLLLEIARDALLEQREPVQRVEWLWLGVVAMRFLEQREGERDLLEQLADWHYKEGDTAIALDYLRAALRLCAPRSLDLAAIQARQIDILQAANQPRQAIAIGEEALQIARAHREHHLEIQLLITLGRAHRTIGESVVSLVYLKTALPLCRELALPPVEGECLCEIGLTYRELGQLEKALRYLRSALPLAGDEAAILIHIGQLYRELDSPHNALKHYIAALSLIRADQQPRVYGDTLNMIGLLYDQLNEKEEALGYFREALPYRGANPRSAAKTLINIGAVYDALSSPDDALTHYREALRLVREVGDDGLMAAAANNIALVYWRQGEYDKALQHFNLALPIFRQHGHHHAYATTTFNKGLVYQALGDYDKALLWVEEAINQMGLIEHPALDEARETWVTLRQMIAHEP